MGRSGATGTGVFVAGLGAATGMEFDTVWLLGMSEGDYPGRSGEDPLLPEYVRAQVLKGALPLRREAQLHERRDYLAALAGRGAATALVFTGRPCDAAVAIPLALAA